MTGKEELMIKSITHHLLNMVACSAASGAKSLVFINDVIADRSNRMNSEGNRAVNSTWILLNVVDSPGCVKNK